MPQACVAFWKAFRASPACRPGDRFYEAFHFDDNAEDSDALAKLVLAGRKRATAALMWTFEHDQRAPPAPGDVSIVTDFAGTPLCVIRTTKVEVVPYEEVTAGFAAIEGEGDGSLEFWRRVHWAFFGRMCRNIGREPSQRMPVFCEQFEVVFRSA
jgi:uncharacterized protein YhfF